jgi:predicted nucleotidyltransferase
MDKEFQHHELEQILESIAKKLPTTINVYLFGGAVMVYNNLKPSTKDIDVLFEEEKDYQEFIKAAKAVGFITKYIPLEYHHFEMSIMLQNPQTGWRLDLFFRKVCKKFCFNLDVKKRSILFKKINHLNVHFISFEDIFLMKSLTQRERDLDDMNTILGFGLDFKELVKELDNQKEHKWDVVERLLEFEKYSGKKLPLPIRLREQYQEHQKQTINNLLQQQIQSMKKEGKSKKEIMNHFELNEEEWKRFS